MIWCFVSSILFDVYKAHANGAVYETPDGQQRMQVHMVGFVDDSNGQTNMFTHYPVPPISQLIEKTQQDAQAWNDILCSSGGVLELPKCSYHVMHWAFRPNGTPFLTPGIFQPHVGVQNQPIAQVPSSLLELECLPVSTAYKTLGTWQSPDSSMISQFEALKKKSDYFARLVK